MDIKEFAAKYRVRTRRDSCGEEIVMGHIRSTRVECVSHIYDHGDGKHFGVLLPFRTKAKWSIAKKKLIAAGFTIRQDGDTDGTALFDPEDREQVRVAFRVACIKPRRELTPERREALAAQLRAARQSKTPLNFASTPVNDPTFGPRNDAGAPVEGQVQA